jgi:hypothetical protein
MSKIQDYSLNFYHEMLEEDHKTSKMFGVIPILFTQKTFSILLYFSLILASLLLEFYFNSYFFVCLVSFLFIVEHRRIILTRETVLEMCMLEEVYYNWETEENREFLDKNGINFELSNSDRCGYFYERLNYVDCINPFVYLKRHYKFLLYIAALYLFLYIGLLVISHV